MLILHPDPTHSLVLVLNTEWLVNVCIVGKKLEDVLDNDTVLLTL